MKQVCYKGVAALFTLLITGGLAYTYLGYFSSDFLNYIVGMIFVTNSIAILMIKLIVIKKAVVCCLADHECCTTK